MARTDPPNVARSEDKKDSTSNRKNWDRKKSGHPVVWPCTIDGCDKHFAREADLKRHQRTTKLHSMPSFACPQCNATFTRTDAQRRHQKSRHNGVVIEGEQASSSSPVSPTSTSDTAPPPQNSGVAYAEEGLGPTPGGSSHFPANGPLKYYPDGSASSGFSRPSYSLYPATGRNPGWAPVTWQARDSHDSYTPSPYHRSSYARTGTLSSIPCQSDSESSTSDSPRATPISPTVAHETATYTRVAIEPSISPREPARFTSDGVAMSSTPSFTLRKVDLNTPIPTESHPRREGSSTASTASHENDANRDESMPLEEPVHQERYDSPIHRPGSLQDILTNDREPVFPQDVPARVFGSHPPERNSGAQE